MLGVNYVVLGGRFTRDPFIRHTENKAGEPLTSVQFTLAVPEDYKNQQGEYLTRFISCKAIGGPAVFIEKYCKTGTSVIVQGKVDTEHYTNKQGEEVYGQPIRVEKVTFADSGASGGRDTSPTVPSQVQQAHAMPEAKQAEQKAEQKAAPAEPAGQAEKGEQAEKAEPEVMPETTETAPGGPSAEPAAPAPQAPPFGSVPTYGGFNGII